METRKIAVACFIGGALLGVVAFIFAPTFWWLGLLAGMAGGYLSYEFREVLRAIPRAWRMACRVDWRQLGEIGVFSLTMIATISPLLAVVITLKALGQWVGPGVATLISLALLLVIVVGVLRPTLSMPSDVPLTVLTRGINPLAVWGYHIPWLLRWTVRGLVKGAVRVAVLSARFVKYLLFLIHSKERILCALDGTLGGAIAWLWLAPSAETLAAKALVVLSCGLLGAMVGVPHRLLARHFHLVPSR